MKLPVSTYISGTIVDVDFPYHDGNEKSKVRPAVVISYDDSVTNVALLQVTSHTPRTEFDYEISDYEGTGLYKEPSVVRCNCVFSIPNTEMLQKRGVLSRKDFNSVMIIYRFRHITKKDVEHN